MIAIVNQAEELVRLVQAMPGESYGFHRRFGFISEVTAAGRRQVIRRMANSHPANLSSRDEWLFRFAIEDKGFAATSDCVITKAGESRWRLVSPKGTFFLLTKPTYKQFAPVAATSTRSYRDLGALAACLLVFAVGIGSAIWSSKDEAETDKLEEALAQQKTRVIPQVKVVPPKAVATPAAKIVQKAPKTSGAAAQNNLGFLKLLGKKELTKAVGGMPTEAAQKSAGVGKGGTQGSGGELLTGLGEGMKKTTVGNTGVAGMGGIGKAGAGGGEGGFGSAYVSAGGAGGGKILSEGDLGKEMELDGGLDRVVIQATIAKYLNQVRACYEKGLRKQPGLAGQVLMDFTIADSGKLSSTKVRKTSLGNPEVETCVAAVMKNWQFPKPVGGTMVKVSYPFTFKPSNYM